MEPLLLRELAKIYSFFNPIIFKLVIATLHLLFVNKDEVLDVFYLTAHVCCFLSDSLFAVDKGSYEKLIYSQLVEERYTLHDHCGPDIFRWCELSILFVC